LYATCLGTRAAAASHDHAGSKESWRTADTERTNKRHPPETPYTARAYRSHIAKHQFHDLLPLIAKPSIAESQENCNTALTRIANRAVEKAIADHRNNACAGLKSGPIGIDKTEALELRNFRLCETGSIVAASITVRVRCATSDQAVIRASVEDDLTATASANLDTCQVLNAKLSAAVFIAKTGLQVADLDKKLGEAAQKEIAPYCK
jgi:hypothetical protein